MQEREEKVRIAIFDNNEIDVLLRLSNEGIDNRRILESYDYILIPGWVWEEVCDSVYRKSYIDRLRQQGYPIKIISESQYYKVLNEELTLLDLFEMSITPYGELKQYLWKNILQGKEKVEIDYRYSEWIELFYDNWALEGKTIINAFGRERRIKKNAGEISIAFLAYILIYQKQKKVEVTIYSHDADCKCCMNLLKEKTEKKAHLQFGSPKTFSYKSLESILQEFWRSNYISKTTVEYLIDKIRSERTVIYLRKKEDNTYEQIEEKVDNNKAKELIGDNNIIWFW